MHIILLEYNTVHLPIDLPLSTASISLEYNTVHLPIDLPLSTASISLEYNTVHLPIDYYPLPLFHQSIILCIYL